MHRKKRVQFLILRVLGSRKSSKRNFCGHSSVFGVELFHGQKAKQSKQLKSEIGGGEFVYHRVRLVVVLGKYH